jgi:hypothetical protein
MRMVEWIQRLRLDHHARNSVGRDKGYVASDPILISSTLLHKSP